MISSRSYRLHRSILMRKREGKSQVCMVGMHGFARSPCFLYLSLKVTVVIIDRIKKKVNKLILLLLFFISIEINTRISNSILLLRFFQSEKSDLFVIKE